MSDPFGFIVTVEHASPAIPPKLEPILGTFVAKCDTHQVYDPGTKAIGERLAKLLQCEAYCGQATRLAIDLNRSLGNASQFSPPIFESDELLKAELIETIFLPFRNEVRQGIESLLLKKRIVVHLSIHSFTKVFKGNKREVDLGILFDEQRPLESILATNWLDAVRGEAPDLCLRANEPYHGAEDGHTTGLRRVYPANRYIGIEIEFSQDLPLAENAAFYATLLFDTLTEAIRSGQYS